MQIGFPSLEPQLTSPAPYVKMKFKRHPRDVLLWVKTLGLNLYSATYDLIGVDMWLEPPLITLLTGAAQMNFLGTFFYFHFCLFVCFERKVFCCYCCFIVAQLTFTYSDREKRASRDMAESQSIMFVREGCLCEENISHTLTFPTLDLVHKHSHTQL